MDLITVKLAPVILIFGLGLILKKLKVFNQEHADIFLKFAFYVTFPASILLAISRIKLSFDMMYIPITAMAVIIISFFVSRSTGSLLKLPKPTFGAYLISTMIMNIGFTFPFFLAAFGQEGFALATLYDFGNGLLVLTFVYFIAIKHGSKEVSPAGVFNKLLKNPNLWALLIGLGLNLGQIQLPQVLNETLTVLRHTLTPLFMLSLGLSFTLSIVNAKALFSAITIRMALGLIIALLFVDIFNLDGLSRNVVLICSAAPVGFTALTYASMENLDKQLAASLVSLSVFIGMFSTTILLLVLS